MIDPIANLNLSYLIHQAKNQQETIAQFAFLNRYLSDNLCTFKGEAMPSLLKPNFISHKQTQTLIYAVEKVSSALNKFINHYMKDKNIRNKMNFSSREEQLFAINPGYQLPLVISRLDAFLQNYAVKFLEFNCDSPAGIAYADVMEDGFKELFNQYDFLNHWKIDYIRRQDLLLKSLLDCYEEFRLQRSGLPAKPVIAIVDWETVSTFSEFRLLQNYFNEKGCRTVLCSPDKIRIINGEAKAGDVSIHLVYRRVITRELLEKWDEVQDFIECIRRGLVCSCNSFRSYIVGSKKALALITDPEIQHIFSNEELDVIKKTIPWTKILTPSIVTFKEVSLNLQDFIIENKDLLVLKPANSYGGKDVFLGPETEQSVWEKIMNTHLHDESWVVQEYVDIPQDIFPEISSEVKLKLKKVNINPFTLLGKYSGTITRVSDNSVINVSAGGGLVPTLKAVRKKDILE